MKAPRLRTNLRRLYLVVLYLAVLFMVYSPEPRTFIAGTVVLLLGRGLQAWSSGHLWKVNDRRGPVPPRPTTSGPYAYVRNPILWASFVSDLGYAILSSAAIPAVVYSLIYWWVSLRRIVRYEEPMLRRLCGEPYERYRQAVPRILPRMTRHRGPEATGFSMRRLWRNGEVSRLIGAFSLVAFFRVVWLLRDGEIAGPRFWLPLGLAFGLGAVSLILQAFEYRPHLGRRRLAAWLGLSSLTAGPSGDGESPVAPE